MPGSGWARNLFAYNEWANTLVLGSASRLSAGDFMRDPGGSDNSVRTYLRHILVAQNWWHSVLTGKRYDEPPPVYALSCEDMRERFAESHKALSTFAAGLADKALGQTVSEREDDGSEHPWVVWHLIVHIVNHGTQHRAEVGVAMTALGQSPGDLDYGHFCDINGSDSSGSLATMRTLYDYNTWANGRVLMALEGLGDEDLKAERGVSHTSIAMDLLHLLGAQVGWLSIWQRHAPRISLPSQPGVTFGENLADWLGRSNEAIREFIDGLGDSTLAETRTDNEHGHNPSVKVNREMMLWDMMYHVVNHGTQHRGEVGAALQTLDRSPGDLDFIDFTAERGL